MAKLLNWEEAKKVLSTFLATKQEIRFKANFPVCNIVEYFDDKLGSCLYTDTNNSGMCHDLWFTYRYGYTVQMCTYHADIFLYVETKLFTH